jgi:hypothetical protein
MILSLAVGTFMVGNTFDRLGVSSMGQRQNNEHKGDFRNLQQLVLILSALIMS